METRYEDFDYSSVPVPEPSADSPWIFLPWASWQAKKEKLREARQAERLAALPRDHKIILVPADPAYSPIEEELWPIINQTILGVLAKHQDILAAVSRAVDDRLAQYRGWRNPFPANLHC